jgi:Aldehyde dehydrogenase family
MAHTDVYDEFVSKFAEPMQALRVGDPTDPDTDVGPLATEHGRADVEKLVDEAVAAGAVIRCVESDSTGPAGSIRRPWSATSPGTWPSSPKRCSVRSHRVPCRRHRRGYRNR